MLGIFLKAVCLFRLPHMFPYLQRERERERRNQEQATMFLCVINQTKSSVDHALFRFSAPKFRLLIYVTFTLLNIRHIAT